MNIAIHEGSNTQLNTVLLSKSGFFKQIEYGESTAIVLDGSSLVLFMEELISVAATNIAIPERNALSDFVGSLPKCFRKRVVVVDRGDYATIKANAILAPVFEEFNIKNDEKYRYFTFGPNTPKELIHTILELYSNLYSFIIGLENQLQIDIDLEFTKKSINTIRCLSRNPKSAANMATLYGIFSTYQTHSMSSIGLISNASEHLVDILEDFIQDETYKMISMNSHLLGIPVCVKKSLNVISRMTKKLITNEPFKQILNLGSKSISAATQMPLPDTELAASLIKKEYLPPIVCLDNVYGKAKDAWENGKYEFLPPKSYSNR